MPKRICLGGSFNPIHHGHLLCARAAAEVVEAQTVVLVPTGQPPHKQGQLDLASAADRLQMCRLAIEGVAGFEVDDLEVRRNGPSYTLETVRELKRSGWDEVSWLIGADMLQLLPSWHEPAALLAETKFIIMARPGWTINFKAMGKGMESLHGQVVQVPQLHISATDIRRRVRAGLPIDFLTPAPVCRYIQQRKLYV
jgi:nicotinate-nucleotide adenylyltransferase